MATTIPKKHKMSAEQALQARMKVKVVKDVTDDRTSLCGEPMQTRKTANGVDHFFIIPSHQATYVSRLFPHYSVSDPFEVDKDWSSPEVVEDDIPDLGDNPNE